MESSNQELLIKRIDKVIIIHVITSIKAGACCFGEYRCVLSSCQGGKTTAMTPEEPLLLPCILVRVKGHLEIIWSPPFYREKDYA